MDIRSITFGAENVNKDFANLEATVSNFFTFANACFKKNGYKIRTNRITTSPVVFEDTTKPADIFKASDELSYLCRKTDIRWFCFPVELSDNSSVFQFAKIGEKLIKYNENLFLNCIVADKNFISLVGVRQASKLIKQVSRLSNNGFDNFRVGVSCNSDSNTPFFPYSFHKGKNGFSLALELIDDLLMISEPPQVSLCEFRKQSLAFLETEISKIDSIGLQIEKNTGVEYLGLDASLAPFPNGKSSVGLLIERLGLDQFGGSGTVFITSFLTDIVKVAVSSVSPRIRGFNGVMFSLLEDDYVARRNDQKLFSLDSLILYSSVCGCGLDMVPVPGDITEEEISSIIYDVAALALKANKPLGIRLLPVNGKQENERTDFNYDFLVDSRVMGIRNRSFQPHERTLRDFFYLNENINDV